MFNLVGIRPEGVEIMTALMHEEISEVTVVLDGLVTMIDLNCGIVHKLLLLWVKLSAIERIVVCLH